MTTYESQFAMDGTRAESMKTRRGSVFHCKRRA